MYRTFDMGMSDKNADVWWSKDGKSWNKMTTLKGDFEFGLGNWDAKVPGYVAPWYSRFGHSLNAIDSNNDGITDMMILAGGDSPIPSNDVWISPDGESWFFDGYAPWSERSHHAATVFKGELWILGGAPLTNDVWAGRLIANRKSGKKRNIVRRYTMANQPYLAVVLPMKRASPSGTCRMKGSGYQIRIPVMLKNK